MAPLWLTPVTSMSRSISRRWKKWLLRRNWCARSSSSIELKDGRQIHLLGEGRLINLASAEGHPASVMDMSFANQALSVEYVVKHSSELQKRVYSVPEVIDREIALASNCLQWAFRLTNSLKSRLPISIHGKKAPNITQEEDLVIELGVAGVEVFNDGTVEAAGVEAVLESVAVAGLPAAFAFYRRLGLETVVFFLFVVVRIGEWDDVVQLV
jgi:hypothetical protein